MEIKEITTKLQSFVKAGWNSVKKHNNGFQNILNVSMLVTSIFAIWLANKSYTTANRQFEDNSKKSDSIFDLQYENEIMINANLEKIQNKTDSIFEIQSELTNKQISIIDQQLIVSQQILKDQIIAGAPKLINLGSKLKDRNTVFDGKYSPIITTHYKNVGNRYAFDLEIRSFYLSEDLRMTSSNIEGVITKVILGPNEEGATDHKPKLDNPVTTFYYCFEITYLDKLTDKKYYLTTFTKFFKNRGKENFYICDIEQEKKLRDTINFVLFNKNLNLLNE